MFSFSGTSAAVIDSSENPNRVCMLLKGAVNKLPGTLNPLAYKMCKQTWIWITLQSHYPWTVSNYCIDRVVGKHFWIVGNKTLTQLTCSRRQGDLYWIIQSLGLHRWQSLWRWVNNAHLLPAGCSPCCHIPDGLMQRISPAYVLLIRVRRQYRLLLGC